MQGLIIAAGRGSRLAGRPQSKPLLPVGGRPLIDWVLLAALEAGLREFVVVVGYAREALERHLESFAREQGVSIACVPNDEWEKENGLSVYKARGSLHGAFVLMMSDHIVEPRIVERICAQPLGAGEILLAVDFRLRDHPTADLDDVTKVLARDGRIEGIGKTIGTYNAFDTGVFLCSPGIFTALERSQGRGDFSLSGGDPRAHRSRQGAGHGHRRRLLDRRRRRAGGGAGGAAAGPAAGAIPGRAPPVREGRAMKVFGLKTVRDWVKALLTLVGVVLFVYLLRRTGLKTIGSNLASFGPWFLATCSLGATFFLFQAAGWWVILKSFFQPAAFWALFRIKIISSAFNLVLPSASLGGDAMRAFMIREHVPLKDGIPSVLFDKTIEFVASLIFLISGFVLGLLTLRLPKSLIIPVVISLAITAACTFFLIFVQKTGVTKALMTVGRFIPGGKAWAAEERKPVPDPRRNAEPPLLPLEHEGPHPDRAQRPQPPGRGRRGHDHHGRAQGPPQLHPGAARLDGHHCRQHRFLRPARAVGGHGGRQHPGHPQPGLRGRGRAQPVHHPAHPDPDLRRAGAPPLRPREEEVRGAGALVSPVERAVILLPGGAAERPRPAGSPLRRLLGLTLVERAVLAAAQSGVKDFLLVGEDGAGWEAVTAAMGRDRRIMERALRLEFLPAERLAEAAGRGWAGAPFWLLRGNLVFDAALLAETAGKERADGELLRLEGGLALCPPALFAKLAERLATRDALRAGADVRSRSPGRPGAGRSGRAPRLCLEVSDRASFRTAERRLLATRPASRPTASSRVTSTATSPCS